MIVERKYYVGYQYITPEYKLRNGAMLAMFEDLAAMHGELAGEDIRTSASVWVLTGYHTRVLKRPSFDDTVTVRTWSRRLSGVIAAREFEILDGDGELAVRAVSEWAHVFRDGSGFSRVTPDLAAAYGTEADRTGFPDMPRLPRMSLCSDGATETLHFRVGRAMTDMNRHLNNVRYLELAENALPDTVPTDYSADGFYIFYKKEIPCGESVVCRFAETDGDYRVFFVGTDGNAEYACVIFNK